MSIELIVRDLGLIPYREGLAIQEELFNSLIKAMITGIKHPDYLLLCQHRPVITLGKNGKESNLLVSADKLSDMGIELYRTNRGGDITYHGPGQLVAYPLLDLNHTGLTVRRYVWMLETVVIELLQEYGIRGERAEGAAGVWIEPFTPRRRKICAIGIRSSHFVTMHGLALNVNNDLAFFSLINPCGYTAYGVTSLSVELKRNIPLPEVQERMIRIFRNKLQ